MSRLQHSLRRSSARLEARLRNARPASVLILVVALLVLMALIGTAWLSTARVDRYTTRQASANTQIDLLVDGVVNMVKAAETADVVSGAIARPGSGSYAHLDDGQTDGFISSRVPVILRDVCPIWTPGELSHPVEMTPPFNFVPPAPFVEDPARPRKYYEGQFVQLAGTPITYWVCRRTHVYGPVDLVNGFHDAPPSPAHPFWIQVGTETTLPPVDDTVPPTATSVYSKTIVWPVTSRLESADEFEDLRGTVNKFRDRTFVIPTYMDFAGDPKFPALRLYSSNAFPAAAAGFRGGLVTLPAADTDGDGVADAALFRLPVGTLEGLDYFAAVRVIDNNAAINFNTAGSQYSDIENTTGGWSADAGNSTTEGLMGAYRSHIGLQEWLNPDHDYSAGADPNVRGRGLEMAAIKRWRFNTTVPANAPAHGDTAKAEAPDTYTETLLGQGEALETQLAWRLGSPGMNTHPDALVGGVSNRYRTFPVSSGLSLAYRGGLVLNPDASAALFETTLADTFFPNNDWTHYDPVYDRAPNRGTQKWTSYKDAPLEYPRVQHPEDNAGYASSWPTFIYRWFDENYNHWGYTDNTLIPAAEQAPYGPVPNTTAQRLIMGSDYDDLMPAVAPGAPGPFRRSIRPLLVARNPLSNQAPMKGTPGGTLGSIIPPTGPAVPVTFSTSGTQNRASVNTAAFGELWRAYWAVMAQEWTVPTGSTTFPTHTPFSDAYRAVRDRNPPTDGRWGSWHNNPFTGMPFVSDNGTGGPHSAITTPVGLPPIHPLRMFRSPIRPTFATAANPWGNTTPRMGPDQVLVLRAAIAAANALELRDTNYSITPHDIAIPESAADPTVAGDATPDLTARVFGNEPQPFITEVYADSMDEPRLNLSQPKPNLVNANGYIAIELYNPYNVPIDIQHCRIATINRQDQSGGSTRNFDAGPPAGATASGSGPHAYVHDYLPVKLALVDHTPDPGGVRHDRVTDPDYQIRLDPAPPGNGTTTDVRIRSNMQSVNATTHYHSPTVIPPRGYLILENFDAREAAATHPRAAQYRPPALGVRSGNPVPPMAGEEDFIHTQPPFNVPDETVAPYAPPEAHSQRIPRMNFAFVPNLDRLLDHEFVLLRPLAALAPGDPAAVAVYMGAPTPAIVYGPDTATTEAVDMAPLDSFDFTGLLHPLNPGHGGLARAWHYVRANRDPIEGMGNEWKFVYPGRYDGNKSVVAAGGAQLPRQQGTDEAFTGGAPGWPATDENPWEKYPGDARSPAGEPPDPAFSFGRGQTDVGDDADASYPTTFTIQVAATGFAGPASAAGAFQRNGDILQIPFIGAYRIKLAGDQTTDPVYTGEVLEINALPMDASYAEDTDLIDDPIAGDTLGVRREQIGRFNPLPATDMSVAARGTFDLLPGAPSFTVVRDAERTAEAYPADYWAGATGAGSPNDTAYDLVITSGPMRGDIRTVIAYDNTTGDMMVHTPWTAIPGPGTTYELRRGTYRWATDLFDHLTVHSPHNDLFPNNLAQAPTTQPVSNYGGVGSGGGEATAPIEGLINLNTASWRVLASIPWLGHNTDLISYNDGIQNRAATPLIFAPGLIGPGVAPRPVQDNHDVARAIVAFRDSEIASGVDPNRVFTSMFDLYRVPGFLLVADSYYTTTEPDDAAGDLSPLGAALDQVRGDFEEQNLFLNRISNLITTRSDSFTNYILVQGWRGIGTANPELVVQRRKAFMSDRSGVTSTNKDVATEFFYNE